MLKLAWGEVIVMVLTSDSHLQPVLSGSGERGGGGGGGISPFQKTIHGRQLDNHN